MACLLHQHYVFFAVDGSGGAFFGHPAGHKVIGPTVDQQQRQPVVPDGLHGRSTVNGKARHNAAADVCPPKQKGGQLDRGGHHTVEDLPGRGKAAVGGDAPDIGGQVFTRGEEDGAGTHAHAAQEHIARPVGAVVKFDPCEGIQTLLDTEGDVFTFGFAMGALADQEQVQSQAVVDAVDAGKIVDGDVVVIRYEGPKGGPGMQEMLYPTSYLKSKHLDKACALITDGRFSGGTSGLSIGHVSPEAASGGEIGIIRDGDMIDIDITARSINLRITDYEMAERMAAWSVRKPQNRDRVVPQSLRAYSLLVSSADQGAVRIVPEE